jgi:hypothetical protein
MTRSITLLMSVAAVALAADGPLKAQPDKAPAASAAVDVPDDGFAAGAKLTGTYSVSYADKGGKKVVSGTDLEVEVTKRSGKEFTAEVWSHNRKTGFQVEGTINQGQVRYTVTKALTTAGNEKEVGNTFFAGRFEKGALTGTVTTPKLNPTLRGEVKVKLGTK